jgi:hypothetical protein
LQEEHLYHAGFICNIERVRVSDSGADNIRGFLDYDALFNNMYRDIAWMIKQNHIFSCCDDNNAMQLIIQLSENAILMNIPW